MDKRTFFLKILTAVLFIVGVAQLAMSQVHILATTKIFDNSIGIYLFLFIIFGLTTGFNAVLIEKPRSLLSFIFSGLLASGSGLIYLRLLQADVLKQEALTLADVNQSWRFVIFAIVIYVIGTVAVPILSWPDVKLALNGR